MNLKIFFGFLFSFSIIFSNGLCFFWLLLELFHIINSILIFKVNADLANENPHKSEPISWINLELKANSSNKSEPAPQIFIASDD